MRDFSELTIIIVTYKTNETILFNCLNSIKEEINIINVENSSDLSHKNKIEERYKNVKVILSGSNLGYGSANNIGLKNSRSRYVLVSNPDVTYNDNFFDELKYYLDKKIDFSIIGPSYNDQSNYLPYGSFDGSKNLNTFNEFSLKEVDYVVGCSMLIDTKSISTQSYFDENFFLYFEETDLCKRIKKKGGKIFCSSKLLMSHLGYQGSISTNPKYEIESEMIRNWHWMWSTFYFHKKHSGYIKAFYLMIGKLIRSFIKMIFFSILYNKKKQKIYFSRFSGLINSMLGKRSWFRVKTD